MCLIVQTFDCVNMPSNHGHGLDPGQKTLLITIITLSIAGSVLRCFLLSTSCLSYNMLTQTWSAFHCFLFPASIRSAISQSLASQFDFSSPHSTMWNSLAPCHTCTKQCFLGRTFHRSGVCKRFHLPKFISAQAFSTAVLRYKPTKK